MVAMASQITINVTTTWHPIIPLYHLITVTSWWLRWRLKSPLMWQPSGTRSCRCIISLQWRHNSCDGVLNHHPYDCLLNRLFRRISKKTSKLRVTGLCEGNSPAPGEFPAKGLVTRKRFLFDDVIMWLYHLVQVIIRVQSSDELRLLGGCHKAISKIWTVTIAQKCIC